MQWIPTTQLKINSQKGQNLLSRTTSVDSDRRIGVIAEYVSAENIPASSYG